jgi:hypothetical protein
MQSIYTNLDAFRDARREYSSDPYSRFREAPPTFSLSELSAEDRERLEWFDMTDLRDGDLFGSDRAVVEALPDPIRDALAYAQERRLHDWKYGFKARDIRQFLENNPDIVLNFPEDMKGHLSWRQRKTLERLQNRNGRRGHLALVGAEVEQPDTEGTVVDEDNALPMPWDDGSESEEQQPGNRFATMTLEDLAKIDVGYLDEKESEQFSARRQQLRDRAKIARIEAERAARQAKIPEAKETPESNTDDAEKTGFGKFWSGVTKVARQFKPSEIAATGREMRGFVDHDAGTQEGEENPFASAEWQAHAEARQREIKSEKAPQIKGQPEQERGEWVFNPMYQEVDFPGGYHLNKLLRAVEYDTIRLNPGGKMKAAKTLLEASAANLWVYAVRPVLGGLHKVDKAAYEWMTEPQEGGKRKIRAARAAAIGLFAVSAVALKMGLNGLDDHEQVQQAADAANNTDYTPAFDTPGVDNIDPTFKAPAPIDMPTKAPHFDTPGVDSVEPYPETPAPKPTVKAPEVPQTPDTHGTPGVDSITPPPITEVIGSGDVLPPDGNIWDYSSNLLEQNGYKGTDAEVAALKNWLLPKTGFAEDTAHLMPPGFPMPKISVEDLKNILGH